MPACRFFSRLPTISPEPSRFKVQICSRASVAISPTGATLANPCAGPMLKAALTPFPDVSNVTTSEANENGNKSLEHYCHRTCDALNQRISSRQRPLPDISTQFTQHGSLANHGVCPRQLRTVSYFTWRRHSLTFWIIRRKLKSALLRRFIRRMSCRPTGRSHLGLPSAGIR